MRAGKYSSTVSNAKLKHVLCFKTNILRFVLLAVVQVHV